MTVPSRGGRSRRGGGPGWVLLTSLLVLAILASSTLVFTNRVELLRLAVILSLWAAAVAAFVTVIYRRQSELDQARARDMKHVYDLQLDREISARREYELSVEAHLRRQLRAQAAEEMSALRAELASLRSQLEVMLGTDLGHRPALGSERIAVPIPTAPGRVESSRVTVVTEEVVTVAEETVVAVESPIIDVPEEPLTALPEPAATRQVSPEKPAERLREQRGAHRRAAGETASEAAPARNLPPRPYAPPRPFVPPQPIVPPGPVVPPGPYVPAPPRAPARADVPPAPSPSAAPTTPQQPEVPWRPPETRRGRHSSTDGGRPAQRPEPSASPHVPAARHWVPADEESAPAGRHRGLAEPPAVEPVVPRPPASEPVVQEPVVPEPASEPQGQHVGGQSVAELMARLRSAEKGSTENGLPENGSDDEGSKGKGSKEKGSVGKAGGGGRRRRDG